MRRTVLGFAHTVGEFGLVLMIGGNIPDRTKVLSVALFDCVETSRWREASMLAGLMVIFAFAVILTMAIADKWAARGAACCCRYSISATTWPRSSASPII
jgi:molybdate transport system permease protein